MEHERMDTAESGPARKKTRVDMYGKPVVVNASKRSPIVQDPVLREKTIMAIAEYHVMMHHKVMGAVDHELQNISVGIAVFNICYTIFRAAKVEITNPTSSFLDRAKRLDYKVEFLGNTHTISYADASAILKAIRTKYGLEFDRNATNRWIGVWTSITGIIAAYDGRRKEIRVGSSAFKMSQEMFTSLEDMGLTKTHEVLLEGVTFPPEKKSSIAQSLGCMTQCLMLIYSDDKFTSKWKNAVLRTFSHFPHIDTVAEAFSRAKNLGDVRTLFQSVADLALIVHSRQTNRYCPAPNKFARYFFFIEQTTDGRTSIRQNLEATDRAKHINFSGHGAFYHWKWGRTFQWSTKGEVNTMKAAWVDFMATFGVQHEDLNLLMQISDVSVPYTRDQLGNHFQKEGSSIAQTFFRQVQLRYYSKLANSNQTGKLGGGIGQCTSLPKFSGRVSRKIGHDIQKVIGVDPRQRASGSSIDQITTHYAFLATLELKNLVQEGFSMGTGTTQWRDMESLTLTQEGTLTDRTFVANGSFFAGAACAP